MKCRQRWTKQCGICLGEKTLHCSLCLASAQTCEQHRADHQRHHSSVSVRMDHTHQLQVQGYTCPRGATLPVVGSCKVLWFLFLKAKHWKYMTLTRLTSGFSFLKYRFCFVWKVVWMQHEWGGEEKGSQALLVWDTTGSRVSLLDGSSGKDWWAVCPFSPGLLLPTSDSFRNQSEDYVFFPALRRGTSYAESLFRPKGWTDVQAMWLRESACKWKTGMAFLRRTRSDKSLGCVPAAQDRPTAITSSCRVLHTHMHAKTHTLSPSFFGGGRGEAKAKKAYRPGIIVIIICNREYCFHPHLFVCWYHSVKRNVYSIYNI